jgi:PBP1b-binding outer membrane lipoprotein LpoB
MKKTVTILLVIAGVIMISGCTGTDQSPATQPTSYATMPAQVISPTPANDTQSDNETMPELDLPLPPDLTDL